MIDAQPTSEELQEIQERCKDKSLIIIQNKIDKQSVPSAKDLSTHLSPLTPHLLSISAKYGEGIDALEQAIYQAADIPTLSDSDFIVTNARHYDALNRAHLSLTNVLNGLDQNLPGDLLAEDLRDVISILAEITGGQITPQETLNTIFSRFCVGK
jgi:tRNA modification GTPase